MWTAFWLHLYPRNFSPLADTREQLADFLGDDLILVTTCKEFFNLHLESLLNSRLFCLVSFSMLMTIVNLKNI